MNRDLARFLWRLGRGLSSRSSAARMRFVALVLASAGLAFGVLALTFGLSEAHDRGERMRAILPVAARAGEDGSALYANKLVYLTDSAGTVRTALAVWISPLAADAPLPPGLSRWPSPGEAVLSPQLAADLTTHPSDLFGRVAGVIGVDGLEVPNERRVYIRPTASALEPEAMTAITGFGSGGAAGNWGVPTLNAQPTGVLVLTISCLMVVPALLAVVLASGLGADTRLRRSRQLQAMGASRLHLVWLDSVEAWPAIAAGSALAACAVTVLGITGVHVPALDVYVPSAQLRLWWPQAVAALLAANLMAGGVVLLSRVARRWWWSRHRPRTQQQEPPIALAFVCLAAALVAVWVPAWSRSGVVRTLSYNVAVVCVVATLPSLLAVGLASVGSFAARYGLSRGAPGAILGGRQLRAYPVRTARLMGGVAALILLFGQVQLNASTLGAQYELAKRGQLDYGNVVLFAERTVYGDGLREFLRELPPGVLPVWTWIDFSSGDEQPSQGAPGRAIYRIQGSCEGLTALGLSCVDRSVLPEPPRKQLRALSAAIGLTLDDPVSITPVPVPDWEALQYAGARLSLISTDGKDLPVDDLARSGYHHVVGGLGLASVGENWVSSGAKVMENERWVVAWGLLGVLPLVAVTALVLAVDVLRSARAAAPLAALSDRRRWLFSASAWTVWLPLALAGVGAVLAYLILPVSMSRRVAAESFFTPSPAYAWGGAAACIALGSVMAWWSARTVVGAALRWRPGQENSV